uniref:Ovule protein n=1 Tax=Romanomermis culicivorax TaxID=13658 RepID=A0A915IPG4_ROMCU
MKFGNKAAIWYSSCSSPLTVKSEKAFRWINSTKLTCFCYVSLEFPKIQPHIGVESGCSVWILLWNR